MLKQVVSGLMIVAGLVAMSSLLPMFPSGKAARADSTVEHEAKQVKEAQADLAKTETKVGVVANDLKRASDAIAAGETPDAIAKDVREIERKSETLNSAAEELDKDIAACIDTRNKLGATMQRELDAITDPVSRRRQERGWERAVRESDREIVTARRVRAEIAQAEVQAGDLQHIGQTIRITTTLERDTADLHSQLEKASEVAKEFSKRASEVLASLAGEPEGEVAGL